MRRLSEWQACTLHGRSGLGNCFGRIRPGYIANLIDLHEDLTVQGIWFAGKYEPVANEIEKGLPTPVSNTRV